MDVPTRNWLVSLLENLKEFLAKLTSEALFAIKRHTYSVEVKNPVEIPDKITVENLKEIVDAINDKKIDFSALLEAIKAIPAPKDPKDVDLSPVVEAVNGLRLETKEEVKVKNLSDIKTYFQDVVKAIEKLPQPEKISLDKIENLLSDKRVDIDLSAVVKAIKGIKIELPPQEDEDEYPVSEVIRRNKDGSFRESVSVFKNGVTITTSASESINGLEKTYTTTEG